VIRFVLGLAVAVVVVVLLACWLGSTPGVSDVVPDPPAVSTAAETCESTGGKSVVRALPDGTVEGVTCK
jgi:hypothetical protein